MMTTKVTDHLFLNFKNVDFQIIQLSSMNPKWAKIGPGIKKK